MLPEAVSRLSSFDVALCLPEFQELADLYSQYSQDEGDGLLKVFWYLLCLVSMLEEKESGSFIWNVSRLYYCDFPHMTRFIMQGIYQCIFLTGGLFWIPTPMITCCSKETLVYSTRPYMASC